jgi:ribosome maturation factor RimP
MLGVERFLHDGIMVVMASSVEEKTGEIASQVRAFTEEVIAGTPYFIVDVDVRGHKGTRVVEIFIESDTDLSHDDLARISNEVGFLLEVEEVIDGGYTLEVSSPGIKRPLTMPRQFKKNEGRVLRVKYESEDGGTENIVGTLHTTDDDAITLEVASGETQQIPYDAIERAKLELPW